MKVMWYIIKVECEHYCCMGVLIYIRKAEINDSRSNQLSKG